MFYFLFSEFGNDTYLFNVLQYITFRSFIAFIVATLVSIFLGKKFIAKLQSLQFKQVIRTVGPESHLKKQGTPTMGGILIISIALITAILFGNLYSFPLVGTMLIGFSYFLLGGKDDYLKVIKKDTKGVSAKQKLFWQFSTALIVTYLFMYFKVIDGILYFPFFKNLVFDLGWFYPIFASFVIVGTSNAVNLTDGLDGLVTGPMVIALATMSLFAYLAGHVELSHYLYIPHIQGAGELAILGSATIGACIGFLWYNAYPAQMFMGDVGSLSLGGILGSIAVFTKNEIILVVVSGVFVVEALSVMIQVGSYKLRKKRVFKMAPIHHHFELMGLPETKIIVRFWIISLILAILALTSLKLR